MTAKQWRMGDEDAPEAVDALDALVAMRYNAGVDDYEHSAIERLFVSLHGSSAWSRLNNHILWSSKHNGYTWLSVRIGDVPWTKEDVYLWSAYSEGL